MAQLQEWSGHTCPKDPDNYWVDDATGERVNATTNERSTFADYHRFPEPGDHEHGTGSFEVWHSDRQDSLEPGWYWWPCFPGCLPDGEPSGPFPTSEGAYLDAIGD